MLHLQAVQGILVWKSHPADNSDNSASSPEQGQKLVGGSSDEVKSNSPIDVQPQIHAETAYKKPKKRF